MGSEKIPNYDSKCTLNYLFFCFRYLFLFSLFPLHIHARNNLYRKTAILYDAYSTQFIPSPISLSLVLFISPPSLFPPFGDSSSFMNIQRRGVWRERERRKVLSICVGFGFLLLLLWSLKRIYVCPIFG